MATQRYSRRGKAVFVLMLLLALALILIVGYGRDGLSPLMELLSQTSSVDEDGYVSDYVALLGPPASLSEFITEKTSPDYEPSHNHDEGGEDFSPAKPQSPQHPL